jgi:hypothetical protein
MWRKVSKVQVVDLAGRNHPEDPQMSLRACPVRQKAPVLTGGLKLLSSSGNEKMKATEGPAKTGPGAAAKLGTADEVPLPVRPTSSRSVRVGVYVISWRCRHCMRHSNIGYVFMFCPHIYLLTTAASCRQE